MFVLKEGLRAGEQVLLLLGKKQGVQRNLRPAARSLVSCFPPGQPYTCSFCLKISPQCTKSSPANPLC